MRATTRKAASRPAPPSGTSCPFDRQASRPDAYSQQSLLDVEHRGDGALTDTEQAFACAHHKLIYGFLNDRALPADDYYGVAALGYLHAVQRYLNKTELRRYAFSTIAYRAMAESVSRYQHSLLRQAAPGPSFSLETGGPRGQPFLAPPSDTEQTVFMELEERLLLHTLVSRLSPRQQEVVRLRLQGYGIHEVAQRQAVSDKTVWKLLRQIRDIFREVCLQ